MDSIKKLALLALTCIATLLSCKKEPGHSESTKTEIQLREVGTDNSKTVYPGQELHLEALAIATEKIAQLKVQITLKENNYGWDFVKTYTKGYAGLKNADFHEHIPVPETARTGDYDLLLILTDQAGNSSQTRATFKIIRDTALPSANNIAIKLNGNLLQVAANINAPQKLAKIAIEVQSAPWTKLFEFNGADIAGKTSYALDESLEVSPLLGGHYHVNLRITDQLGKSITYAYNFDK